MNVYFACSITGGRAFESAYQEFTRILLEDGHEVPTAHLAGSDVMSLEKVIDPQEVYERDVAWIRACDALIAEVSAPSHGVGYEIGYALEQGKSVLCLTLALLEKCPSFSGAKISMTRVMNNSVKDVFLNTDELFLEILLPTRNTAIITMIRYVTYFILLFLVIDNIKKAPASMPTYKLLQKLKIIFTNPNAMDISNRRLISLFFMCMKTPTSIHKTIGIM